MLDDQAGDVLDNLVLAPGEAVLYLGMYIATNCGPSIPSGVSATANDVCTGIAVSNRFVTACSITCATIPTVTLFGSANVGGEFQFSFPTQPNHTYTVQFTDSLTTPNWQDGPVVQGDGTIVTISDEITTARKFYRVLIQ